MFLDDQEIPIGFVSHAPYHLSRKPLYFCRYFNAELYSCVCKLHIKLEPPYIGPIIDVDTEPET